MKNGLKPLNLPLLTRKKEMKTQVPELQVLHWTPLSRPSCHSPQQFYLNSLHSTSYCHLLLGLSSMRAKPRGLVCHSLLGACSSAWHRGDAEISWGSDRESASTWSDTRLLPTTVLGLEQVPQNCDSHSTRSLLWLLLLDPCSHPRIWNRRAVWNWESLKSVLSHTARIVLEYDLCSPKLNVMQALPAPIQGKSPAI